MSEKNLDPAWHLECTCGFIFRLGHSNEKYAHYIFQQRDLNKYIKLEAEMQEGKEQATEENPAAYYAHLDKIKEKLALTGYLYECPECGRVIWLREGQNPLSEIITDFTEYVPQTERTKMAYETDQENPKRKK